MPPGRAGSIAFILHNAPSFWEKWPRLPSLCTFLCLTHGGSPSPFQTTQQECFSPTEAMCWGSDVTQDSQEAPKFMFFTQDSVLAPTANLQPGARSAPLPAPPSGSCPNPKDCGCQVFRIDQNETTGCFEGERVGAPSVGRSGRWYGGAVRWRDEV